MTTRTFGAIVLLIIGAIIVTGVLLVTGNPENKYENFRNELESNIAVYMMPAPPPPTTGEAVTMAEGDFGIIDICKLVEKGFYNEVPLSCSAATHDNCEAGNCNCDPGGHYIWLINSSREIHSVCIGDECESNEADGYQGVWP